MQQPNFIYFEGLNNDEGMGVKLVVVRKNCGPSMLGLLTNNELLYKWFGSRIFGIPRVEITTKEMCLGNNVEGKIGMVDVIGQAWTTCAIGIMGAISAMGATRTMDSNGERRKMKAH